MGLKSSARSAVLWGASSTLIRDLLQFITMLALVRMLTPETYGRFALAQALLAIPTVLSFKTFVSHALQVRDQSEVTWDHHFYAGLGLNGFAFVLSLTLALALTQIPAYAGAALPLMALSVLFVTDIPVQLRETMLQTEHDWMRSRVLQLAGALLGSVAAVVIALLGGGIWALLASSLLSGLPTIVDLLLIKRWRPTQTWDFSSYRPVLKFGTGRVMSAGLNTMRASTEQATLTSQYGFADLGVFTRSVGLAMISAGRVGQLVVAAVYPVLTRAQPSSEQFRQSSGMLLRGIVWTTIPAAALLAMLSHGLVSLLYGERWLAVAPLLPQAAAYVACVCAGGTAYSLLLANNQFASCFAVDLVSTALGLILIFWLIPISPAAYLFGLAAHGATIFALAITLLVLRRGIHPSSIASAILPPLTGVAVGACLVMLIRRSFPHVEASLWMVTEACAFGIAVALTVRALFPSPLRELLAISPGARLLMSIMRL